MGFYRAKSSHVIDGCSQRAKFAAMPLDGFPREGHARKIVFVHGMLQSLLVATNCSSKRDDLIRMVTDSVVPLQWRTRRVTGIISFPLHQECPDERFRRYYVGHIHDASCRLSKISSPLPSRHRGLIVKAVSSALSFSTEVCNMQRVRAFWLPSSANRTACRSVTFPFVTYHLA
jgi:hypothetical protein